MYWLAKGKSELPEWHSHEKDEDNARMYQRKSYC